MENLLDRGSRHLRKNRELLGRPITQLSNYRDWENSLEILHEMKELSLFFPGIRSPPPAHPEYETHDTSWAFVLGHNSDW